MSDTQELLNTLKAALRWIDAVPSSTSLPAMPGFDRDAVDELIDRIERFDANGWIRCTPETMPKELDGLECSDEVIIAYTTASGQRFSSTAIYEHAHGYWCDPNDEAADYTHLNITHWRPLPAPPTESEA